jgi:L,D-peptidoglycan transpeptidase YkuD (ErfK/YbiS/YcfS/YnhG family)
VVRRLGALVGALSLTLTLAVVAAPAAPAAVPDSAPAPERSWTPPWANLVPARTTQVVRTVSSHEFCRQRWCTVTQAWAKRDGRWHKVRELRSTIGRNGWHKRREGDNRSPDGVYRIKVTFSTTTNPGAMPWKRRRPTSVVSAAAGRNYNTWVEVPGVTSGNRPSMRWGWVVDFNRVRLRPGVGPRPVPGKGSGIFYHTSKPGHRWAPTAGCTQVGNPRAMRWLLTWLRPDARPRIVQNR